MEDANSSVIPAAHAAKRLITYMQQEGPRGDFVGDELTISRIFKPEPQLTVALPSPRRNFRQIGQLTMARIIRRPALPLDSLKTWSDCVDRKRQPTCLWDGMFCEALEPVRFASNDKLLREAAVIGGFLDEPCDESFTCVYTLFTPRLVAFYRARNCDPGLSEDLAQQVMLTVYRKAGQVRDRALFRAWLFRVAHNALCRHYGERAREVETVLVEDSVDRVATVSAEPGPPAFEFMHWMEFLNPRERDVMTLRFVEQWEYHEIAAAKEMPIGTVQWIVFNAKKKLAPRLAAIDQGVQQERNQPKPKGKAA
jgi:RNA polymerase sigma-70 factor (ECF subfamily)